MTVPVRHAKPHSFAILHEAFMTECDTHVASGALPRGPAQREEANSDGRRQGTRPAATGPCGHRGKGEGGGSSHAMLTNPLGGRGSLPLFKNQSVHFLGGKPVSRHPGGGGRWATLESRGGGD